VSIRADGAVAAWFFPYQRTDGGSIPTSALQLRFVEIGMREAQVLNRRWHSLLPRTDLGNLLCGNMSSAFAALFDGRFYAVAIYSQPIVHSMCDGGTVELRRLAVCFDAPRNTASWMMSITKRLVKIRYPFLRRRISYLAVDVHDGTIYRASGWTPVGEIVDARPQRLRGSKQRATGPLQTKSRKQRWEILL